MRAISISKYVVILFGCYVICTSCNIAPTDPTSTPPIEESILLSPTSSEKTRTLKQSPTPRPTDAPQDNTKLEGLFFLQVPKRLFVL